jgi:hypothetical protein
MNALAIDLGVACGFITVLGFLGRVLVLVTRHLDGQRSLQLQMAELAAATAKARRRDRRRLRAIERELFLRPRRGRRHRTEPAT